MRKGCGGKYANNVTYLRDSPALNLPYIPLRKGISILVFPASCLVHAIVSSLFKRPLNIPSIENTRRFCNL